MEFIEARAFTKYVYDYLGVRVIYYFTKQDDEIWLLTIYSKNEAESIPAHVLRQIAKEIDNG